MNAKLEEGIKETVAAAVDESLNAIRFNLNNVLGGLLYSLKLEMEKDGHVGVIDSLINTIINTSRYGGPDGEEYPVYNEKAAEKFRVAIEKALQAHGIEQAWNIGRKKEAKAS